VSKRTQTKDVFERLAELDDAAESKTAHPTSKSDSADSLPESQLASADRESDDTADHEIDTADEHVDEAPDDGSARRLRGRIVRVLVAVVVVAALGSTAYLGWRFKQLDDTEAAGRAALEAAQKYAVVLTTLDTKDIDSNYKQVLDGATGEFKDEYTQGSAQLRQILIDNKATGKGIVVDAAVKSATKTKVEVLLFVDQSVTNAVNPSPRIDRNRVQMTMELVDNRWLASKVEII
jgi:Mce-associated membrane protein